MRIDPITGAAAPESAPPGKLSFLDDPKTHKFILAIIVLTLGYFGFNVEIANVENDKNKPEVVDTENAGDDFSDEETPDGYYSRAVTLDLQPVAKISGPSAGETGNFLILDASESIGDFYAWACDRELPGGISILPMKNQDGIATRCQVASVPGIYRVTLGVSNSKGIDMITWVVTVRGPPEPVCPECPDPKPDPPKPDPEPEPDPPKPDPVPDMPEESREVLNIMQPSGVSPEQAKAVAGAFRATVAASKISGWDTRQLNEELKKSFLAVVGTSTAAKSQWGGYMQWQTAALKEIAPTPSSPVAPVQTLFIKIAIGLEAVK